MRENYEKHYNEDKFWDKIKKVAKKAGSEVIEKVLTLYNVLISSGTSIADKGIIIGALGYFIFPLDVISDLIPVVGYTDDLGVIGIALKKVSNNISSEIEKKVTETMKKYF